MIINNKQIIILLSPIILSVCFCSSCITVKKNSIKGIRITQIFPYVDSGGKLMFYDTSFTNIYYYRDQIIYNSSYHFNYTPKSLMTKADEIRHYFFVYTKEKKYGLLYDEHKPKPDRLFLVDSTLKKEWCNNIDVYSNFLKSQTSKIYQNANADSGTINQLYEFKLKDDTTFNGTVFYGFTNKLKNISYSLSKELDSLNNMKLYKVSIVNNSRYIKEYNITLDRLEQTFSLEEIQITNEKELLYYFDNEKKHTAKK